MSAFREFIDHRRAICEAKIAELQARERELKAELARCVLEIDTLYGEIRELEQASRAIGVANKQRPASNPKASSQKATVTIKSAILAVLSEAPDGLIALDILNRINQRFGLQIVRTSLSPQLTRLKEAGEIKLRGSIWTRASHSAEPFGNEDGEHGIGPEGDASGPQLGGSRPLTPALEEGE